MRERNEASPQLVSAKKAGGRPGSRIAVPRRPSRGGPDSIWFARIGGEKARCDGTRWYHAGSRGSARHLAESMAPRFRARLAFLGAIYFSEPVAHVDGSTFSSTRNWSDHRPLFSYRSDRSSRPPCRPPRAPGSHRLDRISKCRDLRQLQLDVLPDLPGSPAEEGIL